MVNESPGGAIGALAARVAAGERRALSRAITLCESGRQDHREQARALLAALPSGGKTAIRVGLSGTPGVGKSTFIEGFGLSLTGRGKRVAVLAVDPSSRRSGGSILGDKTRMERLSRDPGAFIRPTPSGGALGGVARRTREAILLCEAAGYDIIIVETVGVGQSETMVADMTDVFLLLLAPAGGDELQGVKRGVMEIADLIVVNKADGDLMAAAQRTRADYAGALRLLRKRAADPEGTPAAMTASAMTGDGIEEVWHRIETLDAWRREHGWREKRRAEQAVRWMRAAVEALILGAFHADDGTAARIEQLERAVASGQLTPEAAAQDAVAPFLRGKAV